MRLEEAIETLQRYRYQGYYNLEANELVAIRLGIEALKRIHSKRITMSYHPDDLLPGETKG